MKNSEVLDKAADYIDEHGWCQGVGRDDDGHVCAMRAIGVAGAFSAEDYAYVVEKALPENSENRDTWVWLHQWNDAEGRSQAEVTGLLRRVAAAERAEGR